MILLLLLVLETDALTDPSTLEGDKGTTPPSKLNPLNLSANDIGNNALIKFLFSFNNKNSAVPFFNIYNVLFEPLLFVYFCLFFVISYITKLTLHISDK